MSIGIHGGRVAIHAAVATGQTGGAVPTHHRHHQHHHAGTVGDAGGTVDTMDMGAMAGCAMGAATLGAAATVPILTATDSNTAAATAADGAPTISSPEFASIRAAAASSPIATQVLTALAAGNVPIHVLSDAAFNQQAPGAGAYFDDQSVSITMPQSALRDPAVLALELTHEGTHYLDHLAATGTSTTQAADGSALLASTDTQGLDPSTRQYGWQTELHAYTVEAQAAQQLGIQDQGLGTNADGTVRSQSATLAAIEGNPLYADG